MNNLAFLTDFYEMTMANGYFESNYRDEEVVFDYFFRKVPDSGGFAVFAGLEQLINYLENIEFNIEEIKYLEEKKIFSKNFIEYLKKFKFSASVYSFKEGTPVFPNEPILTVKGPLIEVQIIETALLMILNHQSLIATKASRIVRAASGRPVIEFGSRRAHGFEGALLGARAAYIGGCAGTSLMLADYEFNIPVTGTMGHSWVQLFESEYEAFKRYCEIYPDEVTLLIDTYSVLESGIKNAVKAFDEVLLPLGQRPKAIRIDSGDIAYLSRKCRKILDESGYDDCKILVSNSLDEFIIKDLITNQKAPIDLFGVGERLITSKSEPVFGGVYKLSSIIRVDREIPKIKLSENVEKITNPSFKEVYRFFDRNTGMAIADVITKKEEVIDEKKSYDLFDENFTWKRKKITNFRAEKLQVEIFKNGKKVYNSPSAKEIRDYSKSEINKLWEEYTRIEMPSEYYVDLSQNLWNLKQDLLRSCYKSNE